MAERTKLHPIPRWVWRTAAAVAIVALAIVLFLAWFDWDMLRGPVAREASRRSGRPVSIAGHLKVHLLTWTPTATVGGLTVGNPAWVKGGGDLAQVGQLTVSVKLLPLLIGQVELPLVDLENADIRLYRNAADQANWRGDAKTAKPFKLPPIQHFIIHNGHLRMVDERRHLTLTGTVQSQENDVQVGGKRTGSFALDGTGTINRDPFSLRITGGPLIDVRRDQPYPFDGDLHAGQTHVVAHGVLPKPFDFGQVDTAINVTGPDLGDLYDLTGIAFPATRAYALKGRLVRDQKRYHFSNINGRVGDSDLDGDLTSDTTSGRPDVTADLHSRNLNYRDLGSLVGAPPRSARDTPQQKAEAARLAAENRFLPDASLNVEKVRVMDATLHYSADSVTAPNNFPLRRVKLTLILDHGVMKMDPVSFVMPHGELTGHIKIDARGAVPHNDVDIKVLNLRLEDLFPHAKGPAAVDGGLEARAVLTGDGDSVHKAASNANGVVSIVVPQGRIRAAFAELMGINVTRGLGLLFTNDKSDTGLRCGVANFHAAHGQLTATTFVIDTDVVRAEGKGTIDLNTEAMDLTLNGKPKQFRLFHLAAPVSVGGHIKSPKFGLKPGNAPLQIAGSVALGVVLTPAAAILPFIDPGLSKDADCVALVASAEQKGAPVKPSATTTAPSKHR